MTLKQLLLFVAALFFGSICCAQQSNVALGDACYDADNYAEACTYYKRALEGNELSPELLYRYAYSCEQLGTVPKSQYAPFYAAAAYLFEQSGSTASRYYAYALHKEQELGVSHAAYNADSVEKLIHPPEKPLLLKVAGGFCAFIGNWWLLLILPAIILYSLALRLSHKTACIIVYTWLDMVCLLIAGMIFAYYVYAALRGTVPEPHPLLTVLFFVFLALTVILSVVANWGALLPLYVLVSLLTKLLLLLVIPVVLILYLGACASGTPDKRYKDDTKGNERTKALAWAGAVASALIIPLIKGKE